jgi:hypothetical protein
LYVINYQIDDQSGSNGKSIVIKTKAIKPDSKVFVTLKENITSQPLIITHKKDGESFTVEVQNSVAETVYFDWWIVNKE